MRKYEPLEYFTTYLFIRVDAINDKTIRCRSENKEIININLNIESCHKVETLIEM